MNAITTLEHFNNAINHPYRIGEYFADSDGNIFTVPEQEQRVINLLIQAGENEVTIFYAVNWEDENLFASDDIQIQPIYLKD